MKYMCGATWNWEVGQAERIRAYDTLEELKSKTKCWKNCGIVQVDCTGDPSKSDPYVWIQDAVPFKLSR